MVRIVFTLFVSLLGVSAAQAHENALAHQHVGGAAIFEGFLLVSVVAALGLVVVLGIAMAVHGEQRTDTILVRAKQKRGEHHDPR